MHCLSNSFDALGTYGDGISLIPHLLFIELWSHSDRLHWVNRVYYLFSHRAGDVDKWT